MTLSVSIPPPFRDIVNNYSQSVLNQNGGKFSVFHVRLIHEATHRCLCGGEQWSCMIPFQHHFRDIVNNCYQSALNQNDGKFGKFNVRLIHQDTHRHLCRGEKWSCLFPFQHHFKEIVNSCYQSVLNQNDAKFGMFHVRLIHKATHRRLCGGEQWRCLFPFQHHFRDIVNNCYQSALNRNGGKFGMFHARLIHEAPL